MPSAMSSVSHRLRSCSASGTMLPSGRVRLRRARVVQQHQGEQPVDLGIVHQGRELSGEPDRLGREVDVARVALVEDEVEHAHHRARRRRDDRCRPGRPCAWPG